MLRDVERRGGHAGLRGPPGDGSGGLRRHAIVAIAAVSSRLPAPRCRPPPTRRPIDRARPAASAPAAPRSGRPSTRARRRAAGSPPRSSSARCATASRRASTAATSSRSTPPAGSSASSATRTGSSRSARRSSRSGCSRSSRPAAIEAFDLDARRARDHGQLALGRGPPRPDAPGRSTAGPASARRCSPAAPRACRSTR